MSSAWLKFWIRDVRLVLEEMHPQARIKFRQRGPWWMPGRSLFMSNARRQGLEITHIAFLMDQMDRLGDVP